MNVNINFILDWSPGKKSSNKSLFFIFIYFINSYNIFVNISLKCISTFSRTSCCWICSIQTPSSLHDEGYQGLSYILTILCWLCDALTPLFVRWSLPCPDLSSGGMVSDGRPINVASKVCWFWCASGICCRRLVPTHLLSSCPIPPSSQGIAPCWSRP